MYVSIKVDITIKLLSWLCVDVFCEITVKTGMKWNKYEQILQSGTTVNYKSEQVCVSLRLLVKRADDDDVSDDDAHNKLPQSNPDTQVNSSAWSHLWFNYLDLSRGPGLPLRAAQAAAGRLIETECNINFLINEDRWLTA